MAVRYRNNFFSLGGVYWQVDIHDTMYPGSPNLFTTETSGFQLAYKGVTERLDPILASTLTVPVIINDSTVEGFLTEIMISQEERFTVKVYKNSSLYWVGVLLADQVQKEDIYYPYTVDLTFTDGLARLRDIAYNTNGLEPEAYTGRDTLIAHLFKVLGKTGTLEIYASSDIFLNTAINWFEQHHTFHYWIDPLKYTDLNHSVFYSYDDAGVVTFKTAYEVLEMILRTFNAQIKMVNGSFFIVQPQEYSFPTSAVRTYKADGTSYVSYSDYDFRITPIATTRKTGGTFKYLPSLSSVKKVYKPKITVYEAGGLIPFTYYYDIPVPLTNIILTNTILYFEGAVTEELVGDDFDDNPYFTTWALYVTITGTTTGTIWRLSNSGGTAHWTTDWEGAQYIVRSVDHYGWHSNDTTSITIELPPTPEECTGTFGFLIENHYLPNGTVWFIPSSYQYTYLFESFKLYPSDTLYSYGTGDITYEAFNLDESGIPVKSTKQIIIPDTLIGDAPSGIQLGGLKVNSGLAWYNSALWGIHNDNNRKALNQLSVDQNMIGQSTPVSKYMGSFINNNITVLSAIRWNNTLYIPIMVTINPATDEISGEWFNVIIPML